MVSRRYTTCVCFTVVMSGATWWSWRCAPVHRDQVQVQPADYRIDVNRADAQTLCLLPGVGPGIAGRIITHRQAQGPFRQVSALEDVSDIGPLTRQAIEPWISLDGD